jgi:aerobic-type carbon monoxide dehydrogenase small subunit (CoxS/CutS family)
MTSTELTLIVNGARRTVMIGAHQPLLDVLRDQLELTGTKECCAVGECGACTVLVDGRSVDSCLVLAAEMQGAAVTTVEGLADRSGPSQVQDAFVEHGAIQCGFCIPGMVVSATYLLKQNSQPSVAEVREGLSGNLCRCAGYNRIVDAVLAVAELGKP